MKSIKKIYKEVDECIKLNNRENEISCYINTFSKIINKDKNKLLAYKMEVEKELDFNFASFWVASIALVVAGFAEIISCISLINGVQVEEGTCWICGVGVVAIVYAVLYYYSVKKSRDKYLAMLYALKEIEKNW